MKTKKTGASFPLHAERVDRVAGSRNTGAPYIQGVSFKKQELANTRTQESNNDDDHHRRTNLPRKREAGTARVAIASSDSGVRSNVPRTPFFVRRQFTAPG